ncbi:MAG: 3-methyl-2-oxobutanoate hydroxymethyltransferase [Thermoleophilia bacterium]
MSTYGDEASARGGAGAAPAAPTAAQLRARKGGRRLAMLTAYDYPTALALDSAGLDILLVGDSMGEVELGYDTTRAVSLEMMAHHVRAVRNGVRSTHLCADLTAGTYATAEDALASARRLVDAGADSVKLEGGLIPQVEAIVAAGIPVMGHVGLLPQTAEVYRREGKTPDEADRIAAEARALDAAGCYAIVIEAVPAELAQRITAEVGCPTIGIAAGAECDGQVLVSTDLIGQLPTTPRFVKPRADVYGAVVRAAREFAAEVRGAGEEPVAEAV